MENIKNNKDGTFVAAVNEFMLDCLENGERYADIETFVTEESKYTPEVVQQTGQEWFEREILNVPITTLDITMGSNNYFGYNVDEKKGKRDVPLELKIGDEETQFDFRKSYHRVIELTRKYREDLRNILAEDELKDINDGIEEEFNHRRFGLG